MSAAEKAGFDVFATGDQTLVYEQNLSARKIAVIALSANNWPIVKGYVVEIIAAIEEAEPGSFRRVECVSSAGKENSPSSGGRTIIVQT